jgi:hypothetical protein
MPWAIKKAMRGNAAITVATHGQSLLALEKITPVPMTAKSGEKIIIIASNANWIVTHGPPALKLLGDTRETISQMAGMGQSA